MRIDLKSARIRAGISVQEMAESINKTPATLYSYEQGRSDPPNSVMETYSRLTGISREDLVCLYNTTHEELVMCV